MFYPVNIQYKFIVDSRIYFIFDVCLTENEDVATKIEDQIEAVSVICTTFYFDFLFFPPDFRLPQLTFRIRNHFV